MNGRVMPLAGSSDTATPILMKACTAVTVASPRARKLGESALRPRRPQQQPHRQQAEQDGDQSAQQQAELLPRHREDEIGMGVGDFVFDGARAGTDASQAAMRESLQRQARLAARLGGGEFVQPHLHMGKHHIGEKAQHRGGTCQQAYPGEPQAPEEQHRAPQ